MKRIFLMMSLVVVGALGCGGGSEGAALNFCLQSCEANRRCGVYSDAEAQNCKNTCNANSGAYADEDRRLSMQCSNHAQVSSELNACLGKECNKIEACLAVVDTTCVAK